MRRLEIDFDISKYETEGVSIELAGGIPVKFIRTDPFNHMKVFGIDDNGNMFRTYISEDKIKMYQEVSEVYTHEQIVAILDNILQHPDKVMDAINNEHTDWDAENLIKLVLNETN
jgi:hypothetical protein